MELHLHISQNISSTENVVVMVGTALALVGISVDIYAMVGEAVKVGVSAVGKMPFGEKAIGQKT